MKKSPFLLLDTGPIIKLFELDLWETFIQNRDVTVTRAIAEQAKYASPKYEDIRIDLDPYEAQGLIGIEDVELAKVGDFIDLFKRPYAEQIHEGEKEMLAFLLTSDKAWKICAADGAVFRVLGLLGKAEKGISLEEVLKDIGLFRSNVEWKYTKKFREKYTRLGQIEAIQGKGLKKKQW